MDRSELVQELERLHPESWDWALACCARDWELAEDALQTAYLRILSGRAKFSGRSAIKTWVFGVIRMTSMEETRRGRARLESTDGMDAAAGVADSTPGADVLAERSERSAALIAVLSTLSPRQREVLLLVFYHDLTIEDAAAVMGVSLGAARSHYDRGKKAVAMRLTGVESR